MKFNQIGTIKLSNKTAKFNLPEYEKISKDKLPKGNVYAWVKHIKGMPSEILYIGKTGKTFLDRRKGHENGFKLNKTGLKHLENFRNVIRKNVEIAVWLRCSQRVNVLNEKNISLYDAEEKVLINRYDPPYNRYK